MNEIFLKNVNGLYEEIDYSNVIYKNRISHVLIKCKIHDFIYKQRPMDHYKYRGCSKCRSDKAKLKFEEWLTVSNLHYNNFYDYSEITSFNYGERIVIKCPIHGYFEVNSKNHYLGKGNCLKCVKKHKITTEELINELEVIHNKKYEYKIPNNWTKDTKITAICELGHKFTPTVSNHRKLKSKCPVCTREKYGWSKSSFMHYAKDRECIFYVLECTSEDEKFYKIGITSLTIERRYSSKLTMPYSYKVIQSIKSNSEIIWNIEKYFMKHLKEYHYKPKKQFGGSKTECFKLEE